MKFAVSCLIVFVCFTGNAEAQDPTSWEWTIAPYLWASDVGLDLTVNNETSVGGDAAFKDLLDKVDSVFMGHFEGRKGRWGMYFDTIYLDLSDNKTISIGPGGPILGDLMANAGMTMKLYDVGGIYRLVDMGNTTINVMGDLVGTSLVVASESRREAAADAGI